MTRRAMLQSGVIPLLLTHSESKGAWIEAWQAGNYHWLFPQCTFTRQTTGEVAGPDRHDTAGRNPGAEAMIATRSLL